MGQYYNVENIIAHYTDYVERKREEDASLLQDIAETFGITSSPKKLDITSCVKGGVVA